MRAPAPVRITAAILLGVGMTSAAGAQSNAVRQPLQLPDPTPRPEDLELKYKIAPAPGENTPQAVALRKAQNGVQIHKAADLLVLLAQRLKDDVAAHNEMSASAVSLQRATEIETLAKIVKEREKHQ